MKQFLRTKNTLHAVLTAMLLGAGTMSAQTYTWNGSANSTFYNTSNWTSSQGVVAFDDSAFKTVVTNATGASPVLSQAVAWQPGIFNALSGTLAINAEFNVFFNDWLNGTVNVNTGGIFTCRHIFRVGREGMGTVNINGGILRCLNDFNPPEFQGIFIGALTNGNGTVNVNDGGLISGGWQVEVGTRNNYPTGMLNVNAGGTSEAYWTTVVGPNGTINVNGGAVNTGQVFIVGDLYVDNPGTEGTVGATVGAVNVNSGTVTINQFDLEAPNLIMHPNAKLVIDNGTLRIKRTGVNLSALLNGFVATGQIAAPEGKQIEVTYDGTMYTNVTAVTAAGTATNIKNAFTVYPNPVKDLLYVTSANGATGDAIIKIISITGETVMVGRLNGSFNNNIDVSKLASGMYMAVINGENGSTTTKFIRE